MDFAPPDAPRYRRPDRFFDLTHLHLDLELDVETETITATARWSLVPIITELREVTLDAVGLRVADVTDGSGAALECRTGPETLTIRLREPVRRDVPVELTIRYSAGPFVKGIFFVRPTPAEPDRPLMVWSQGQPADNRYWFPCRDVPDERFTANIHLTVPAGLEALSNGVALPPVELSDGRTTFGFRQDVAHVTYLVTFVVGTFDRHLTTADELLIGYFAPAGRGADLDRTFGRTPDMIRFFTDLLGLPYPYPVFNQVAVPEFTWGGMENTALVVLHADQLHDEAAHVDFSSDGLVAHELSHQWFAGRVACRDWTHLWIHEGFASYLDPLYAGHTLGIGEFDERMWEEAEGYLKEAREHHARAIVTDRFRDAQDLFDAHAYNKAACVLHLLRHELGDEPFWTAVRTFLVAFNGTSVDTDEVRSHFEDATGRDLTHFFAQWLRRPGHPTLAVSSRYADGAVELTVEQTQPGDPFEVRTEIEIWTDGDARRVPITIRERRTAILVPSPTEPDLVLLDPDGWWLLRETTWQRPVADWRRQLRDAPTVPMRREAALALGETTPDPATVAALADALRSETEFYGVARAAARSLGKLRGGAVRQALLDGTTHPHPKVRHAVATALAAFPTDDVLARLTRLASDDPAQSVRAAAVESAGKLRLPGSAAVVDAAWDVSSHREAIRAAAARATAELRDPAGLDRLLDAAGPRWTTPFRAAALSALGAFGQAVPTQRVTVREALVTALETPGGNGRLRVAAADGLGKLRDGAARPALERAAMTDPFPRVRLSARRALAALEPTATAEGSLDGLRTELATLRAELEALRSAGGGNPTSGAVGSPSTVLHPSVEPR